MTPQDYADKFVDRVFCKTIENKGKEKKRSRKPYNFEKVGRPYKETEIKNNRKRHLSDYQYHGDYGEDSEYKTYERTNQNQTSRKEAIPSWEGTTKHSGKVAGTRANRTQGSRGVTSKKPHMSVGGNTMIAPAGRHSVERN